MVDATTSQMYFWYTSGAFSIAILVVGLYLLCSRRPAYASDNRRCVPYIRRLAGLLIVLLATEYMSVLPAIPHWTRFTTVIDRPFSLGMLDIICQLYVLMVLPLFAILAFALFQGYTKLRIRHFLLPVIVPGAFFVCTVVHYALGNYENWENRNLVVWLVRIFWSIYMLGFLTLFFRNVRRFRQFLIDNYSDTANRDVNWILTFGILVFCYSVIYAIIHCLDTCQQWFFILQLAMALALSLFLAWRVDLQEPIDISCADDLVPDEEPNGDLSHESESAAITAIEAKLQQLCVDAKLYLNTDLTRDDLVRALGTNRTYLSNYFSSRGLTFNSYINGLRIEYACQILAQTKGHLYINEVASASGFKSPEVFSRQFKAIKGCAPSHYCAKQ